MDFMLFMQNMSAKAYGDRTVDDTVGGVGFDPALLTWQGLSAKLVRCTLEGGDIRTKEVGAPTASSGDLRVDADEFFVPGLSARDFRAIRAGSTNATLRYHVYF
ncbi:MAG: hypothetical protein ACYC6G_20015 [Desulfobaccales bacterium]